MTCRYAFQFRCPSFALGLLVTLLVIGCGSGVDINFSNRLIGAGGELVVAEDVAWVVEDPTLSDDEKRIVLRDLGIEDEELIDALLTR